MIVGVTRNILTSSGIGTGSSGYRFLSMRKALLASAGSTTGCACAAIDRPVISLICGIRAVGRRRRTAIAKLNGSSEGQH
jgi:hypothetical protein